MIKRSLEKMLICTLIFILLFNFLLTSVTYADPPANETENTVVVTTSVEENEEKHNNRLEDANSGLAGILLMLIRLSMYIPAMIVNLETYAVAISAGKADTDPLSVFITPFDIIFNRFTLTDINIFSIDGLDPDGMVATIRQSVAMWFRVASGIAIGFLIIIFLVILIRLALQDDVAERKAKMKSALVDWLVSLLLVLCMDILVVGLVNLNSMFVQAIKGAAAQDISSAVTAIQDVILSTNTGLLLGFGALFTYFALTIITIIFLVKYIYRFFKVVLLVVIAPLAPIPYAVNRMTDKKSGSSLQIWLFEFIDAVFTQIIHCIIYVCIVGVALQGFAAETEIKGLEALAPCVFAIFAMFFVWPAENLIRKIFGIKRSGGLTSIVKNVASGARDVSSAMASIQSAQTSGTSIIGGIMNNNNNTYNNGLGDGTTPGIADGNVHTKPITAGGDSPILIGNGNIDPATGKPYDSTAIDAADGTIGDSMLTDGENAITADGVPLALGPARDEASEKLDGLNAVVAGFALPSGKDGEIVDTVNTSEYDETHEEVHEETVEEVPIPVATPIDGENENEEMTQKINEKLEEIQKFIQEQLNDILDVTKIKEMEEQIITLITEKIKDIDITNPAELQQLINDVQNEVLEQVKTGDAEQDKKLSSAIENFAKISLATIGSGYEIELDKKNTDIIDVDSTGDGVPVEVVDGVVDETTGYIRDAISTELALVPSSRDVAVDIATKNAIITGEIDNEIDMSDTGLAEVVSRLAISSRTEYGDNIDEALNEAMKALEKEGKDSLASYNAYVANPSREAYEQLSKIGKQVADFENKANAMGFALTTVANGSVIAQNTNSSNTKITHTQSADVLAELQARKGGDQGNT